jgi:hypothetical protein
VQCFGDGWQKILHRPEFGTKFGQIMSIFGPDFAYKSFKHIFLLIFMAGIMPTQRYNTVSTVEK